SIQLQVDKRFAEARELRTIRFASARTSEAEAARRRHARICIDLAESAWRCWYGRDEELWLKRFTESDEDVRTALRWLLDNDPERAMQLSGALTRFWYVRNFPREGYRWLSESLSRSPQVRTVARARALVGAAFLSPSYNANTDAQCREALSIFRECGDQ